MPTPAGAQGSGMSSIACTSSSDCLAAGGYNATPSQSGPFLPLTERWNGTDWTILTTPPPAGAIQTYLNGISCTSPSACTITGEQHFSSGIVETVAERWDGASWTIEPTPNPTGSQFASLWGVDCTGPSACLATGSSDQGTLAERWDGTSWRIDTTPNPAGGRRWPVVWRGLRQLLCLYSDRIYLHECWRNAPGGTLERQQLEHRAHALDPVG
jgi:hypothetical protein